MNTYQECVDYLYSLISYETKPNWSYDNKTFNLNRFKAFLSRLGNPQHQLKIIHVAGSDGKGSTSAIISTVLQNTGYKTGLYTSPHLHSVRERIQINREWIPREAFIHWTNILRGELEAFSPGQNGFTTFFELITAMGFLYFQQEQVDFAVIETGLGGRLDATNVSDPILCVITHISMEHADKLGDSLDKIADEKLGIIRPQSPVVIGHQDNELLPHFHQRLDQHLANVLFVDEIYSECSTHILDHRRIIQFQSGSEKVLLASPLLGYYQTQNVMTAYTALSLLSIERQIHSHHLQGFQNGLQKTKWEGRFEVHSSQTSTIVLDIAHTVKGAESLKRSIEDMFPDKKRIFMLGFLKDKNYVEMIKKLCCPEDAVILTVPPTPRALTMDELKINCAELEKTLYIQYIEDSTLAFEQVLKIADEQSVVVVAGSLYLVSAVRSLLVELAEI